MPAATVRGTLAFGLEADEASLTTQSVSATNKSDKKEARDKYGTIVAVAYYNKTTDISIEGLGASTAAIASALTLNNTFTEAGTTYIDEVTVERANEEFVKSSIKATSYEGL